MHRTKGAVKKLKIGSFRQEACAGAPAPPRWNARSARVFGCGFKTPDASGSLWFNFFPASGELLHIKDTFSMKRQLLSLCRPTGRPRQRQHYQACKLFTN